MKVEINEKYKKFTPIDIKITIESEGELIELVKRLNLSENSVNDLDDCYPEIERNKTFGLWSKLNHIYNFINFKE
jgi:hypothetical protein